MAERIAREPRYFEDYVAGAVSTLGPVVLTEDDIVGYAALYDPQPIHVDRAAADAGPFAGLIASGWHTVAAVMRLLVEHYLSPASALVSPGVDELRWHVPVRPGDALFVRTTIVEATRSQSKPDRGIVRTRVEAFNQRDEIVMSFAAMNLIRCRP
jgi:acyl dehydratase